MSDFKTMCDLLDRSGIKYKVEQRDDGERFLENMRHIKVIMLEVDRENKAKNRVLGYDGFISEFVFSDDDDEDLQFVFIAE